LIYEKGQGFFDLYNPQGDSISALVATLQTDFVAWACLKH